MNKPFIAIPLGDPAGIGPEIVVKSLAEKEIYEMCRPVVVGDGGVVRNVLGYCGLDLRINTLADPASGVYTPGTIDLVDLNNIAPGKLEIGKVQALGGRTAFEYIKKAVDMALAHQVDAIATTPINKESLRAAKVDYIGHTEILAGLTGTHDPLTMFEVRNMRVFFLSRHVSLRKACDMVTKERLLDYIKRCTEALERLGVNEGTMAIAGLNPHSGEHGLFGDEELVHVMPAIQEAQEKGYRVTGPIGADSVFHLALQGRFNSVLSLYHDQGHIATKTLDFERTISLTIGLPFLRTSVDHGTAYDIAGTGKASAVSMIEAIRLAARYSPSYNRHS
jgi:4-hydroxythreonine-4-phosphate dehydrogenase